MTKPLHRPFVVLLIAALLLAACEASQPPLTRYELQLSGTPYERGLQHGRLFSQKIRSFYTMMLLNSLLPYLNRERPDIAAVLRVYDTEPYTQPIVPFEGRPQNLFSFSRTLLAECAASLVEGMPDDFKEEMRGIADGSGLDLIDIQILNTFLDSLSGLRALTIFLRSIQGPRLVSVEWIAPSLAGDGKDNDGDGTTDEADEGRVDAYAPSPRATMVEVPPDAKIRLVIEDPPPLGALFGGGGDGEAEAGGDADETESDLERWPPGGRRGVDPKSLRVLLDDYLYAAWDGSAFDPAFSLRVTGDAEERLEVTLTPRAPLAAAKQYAMTVQVGNLTVIYEPPPTKARYMRDERVTFTTAGFGKPLWEVENLGVPASNNNASAIGFALRGGATATGEPLLAHHFALLDTNAAHKHATLIVHKPAEGPPYAFIGYPGLVWGTSGMSGRGLAVAVNHSDSLDNPLTKQVIDSIPTSAGLAGLRLAPAGQPMGIVLRRILAEAATVDDAQAIIREEKQTFGWSYVLADRDGGVMLVEADAGNFPPRAPPVYALVPGDAANVDDRGRPLASVGADDVIASANFQKNLNDISLSLPLGGARLTIPPQRGWSSFYYRSVAAMWRIRERVRAGYGTFTPESVETLLKTPDLLDPRDSMSAVVFEPKALRIRYAMGKVPATRAGFVTFDLNPFLGGAAR